MNDNFELAIIGGGPAGAAAAIYAARKRLKTILIVADWGGQSTVSTDVQNWIGTPSISGIDLATSLRKHTETYAGEYLTILSPMTATALAPQNDYVDVTVSSGGGSASGGKSGETYRVKALIIATGANRRTLDIPGAARFDQKGLTYCASCDGPLFADQDVAVIGGGNAAFETVLQLLAYCTSVTLLNRSEILRADEVTVAAATSNPKFRLLKNAEPVEVEGGQFVTGLKYKNTKLGTEMMVPVTGIFVEIGLLPNTDWVGTSLEMNLVKQIKVDPRTQRTSHPRVWAAGDCSDVLYHQNNISAGDAVKALEDVYMFLRRNTSQ